MHNLFIIVSLFLLSFISLGSIDVKAESEFKEEHGSFFRVLQPERTDLRVGYLHELDAKETYGPGEYNLQNLFGEFNVQSPISRDSFFSLGGKIEQKRFLFTPVDSALTRTGSENLYGISVRPGIGVFLNDDVLLSGQAIIGNYSDLEGGILNASDYQLLGKSQLVFQINPGTQLLVGASYTNDYLDQKLLPFVGIRLVSETGRFNLSIDFPFFARVGYYITPKIETFGQFVVSGDRFQSTINGEDLKVGVHDQRAGGGLRFWLFEGVSLTFEGGRTVGSELRFNDYRAGQFTNDGEIDSHWYGRTYLGFSL